MLQIESTQQSKHLKFDFRLAAAVNLVSGQVLDFKQQKLIGFHLRTETLVLEIAVQYGCY